MIIPRARLVREAHQGMTMKANRSRQARNGSRPVGPELANRIYSNGFSSADLPYVTGTGTSSSRRYTDSCPR